jgi:hypothetical protein
VIGVFFSWRVEPPSPPRAVFLGLFEQRGDGSSDAKSLLLLDVDAIVNWVPYGTQFTDRPRLSLCVP